MGELFSVGSIGFGGKGFLGVSAPVSALWTRRANPIGAIIGMGASNARIVAFDAAGLSAYSDDHGATWTQGVGPGVAGSGINASIVFFNNLWTAVYQRAAGTIGIYSSADGKTWTHTTDLLGGAPSRLALAVGNGVYVIVADNSAQNTDVWTSPDGSTWTAQPTTTPNAFGWLIFDGTHFLGPIGSEFSVSSDGVTWAIIPTTFSNTVNSLASNGTALYIAGDESSPPIVQSSPSSTWNGSNVNQPLDGNLSDSLGSAIAFGGGLWVLVGFTSVGTFPQAATSPDAVTWTLEDLGIGAGDGPTGVAYLAGTFVCWSLFGKITTRM